MKPLLILNTKHQITSKPDWSSTLKRSGRFFGLRRLGCAFGLAWLVLSMATAQAVAGALTWDALTNGTPSDGSGTWDTGAWWNGSADQAWASTSNAVFGAGTPGTYTVSNTAAMSVSNITFNTSGYTLTGGAFTLVTGGTGLTLTANVNATISNVINLAGQAINVGSGSVFTLGNGFASSGNPALHGSSLSTSTLDVTGGTSSTAGAISVYNVTLNQTGGTLKGTGGSSAMYVGYTGNGTYNLSAGTITNLILGISRASIGILNMTGGAIGAAGVSGLRIASIDGNDNGTLNMSGGTLVCYNTLNAAIPVGSSSANLQPITFCAAAATYTAAAQSVFNFSGGTVAAKGLIFGNPGGHYTANPTCQFTMTGGLLYLDFAGIALSNGVTGFTSPALNISGGTIAATANWTGSMPMTLNTDPTNGNITFQSADTNGSDWNITLSGTLTGSGGLNKTGGGVLTLSGTDSYSGNTVVSNGQFTVDTTAAGTSIGPVSIATGTTLSTGVLASGQSWTNTGLTVNSTATLDFNFGGVLLSPSQPVIEVVGNLTLDESDSVTIEGSSLLEGTYPLITCSGTLTLTGGSTLPAITSLPGGVSAHLSRSGNTINLVVSSSPNNFIKWGSLSSGAWNFTTANWVNAGSGSPVDYSDGIGVDLNDNGNGAVSINLVTNVSPGGITANNTSNGTAYYTITGAGSIGGGSGITLQGTGGLALGTSNTYTGGTTISSGTLAINYGGNSSNASAIGTGPLTITGGALDNTSGSNVVLSYPAQEYWNGNFSYVGSQTNFDLGLGPVTLGGGVQVTVRSNILTYDGVITDNGSAYGLTVQGPGALTLNGMNNYTGGTVLNSGKLNINNGGDGGFDSAIGTGALSINGGTIDNTSGTNIQLQIAIPELWNSSFTFAGSSNLDLGPGGITTVALTLTLQNGATLQTEGAMLAAGGGGVATMTLAGNGAFQTSGAGNNTASATTGLSMAVNSGAVFVMDKSSPSAHSALNLNVNTGGTARVTGIGGAQVGTPSTGTITLAGGTLDLFGSPAETTYAVTFNSGTMADSSTNPAVLAFRTSMNLAGAACYFDVASNGSLALPNYIHGAGSIIKVDGGALNLGSTNSYTGPTIVSNGLLSFVTATTANGDYTVASGELEALLDPTGATLQMSMSSLTFGPGTRLGFDLASGNFGDTTISLISGGGLTMNGNVAVDVTNAPSDANDNVLLSYGSRSGFGSFFAGNIPVGAYIYDNTPARQVILTYAQPPALSRPSFNSSSVSASGGVVSSITFSGTNGTAGGSYEILSSTNLALRPLSAWTQVQSGNFDGSGNFNVTIGVDPAATQTFYLLAAP